jgi:4,5-DOPA dioxygenase extradiol
MKTSAAMPVFFFGHGNPLLTATRNAYTTAWAAVGKAIAHPRAVLAVSAHWYVPATRITGSLQPRTIHDFGGFPPELYQIQYPAPGNPELATEIRDMLAPIPVGIDSSFGVDHGTWTVMRHVFPEADVPVVQLSVSQTKPPQFHYDLGQRLRPLREEGVLIVGSGNVVHNLDKYAWEGDSVEPFGWAVRFEKRVKELLASGDDDSLVGYEALGADAMMSAPTPDHYLPFLYALGARVSPDPVTFPVEGIDGGSVSMLAVRFG